MLLYKTYNYRYIDYSGSGVVKDLQFCINDWPSNWVYNMFSKDILVKPKDPDVDYKIQSSFYKPTDVMITVEFTFTVPHMSKTFIDNITMLVTDLAELTNGQTINNWRELINRHNNSLVQGVKFYDDLDQIDFDIITNKEFHLGCAHEIAGQSLSREDDHFNHWYYCKKCGAWLERV